MSKLDKDLQIVALLNSHTDWVTAGFLAKELGFSVRNIKYTIEDINSAHSALIFSSNKGYKVDKERAGELLADHHDNGGIPRDYEERKKYLINHCLLENQQLSLSELADFFCISPITLQNELSKIRSYLSAFHLNLKTKNEIIIISGLAKDKRAVILDLLDNELQKSFLTPNYIQEIFTTVDLIKIKKLVTRVMGEYEYFLDEYALLNYVLHIALTIELRSTEPYFEARKSITQKDILKLGSPHVLKIVNQLYLKLKELYNTNYDLEDIYEASILMMTRVVSKKFNNIDYPELGKIIGTKIKNLNDDIVLAVKNTYGVELNNESFQIRFSFHLKNLLLRLENNITISTMQFRNIKNDYPLIYAISVFISNIILQHTGHQLPEDEIAYIALHVGVLFEETKAINDKVNCVLVCPDYLGIAKAIFRNLSTFFSESMLISNIVLSLDAEIDFDHTDLILSTMPVKETIAIPYKEIKPFLEEADYRSISALLDDIKRDKTKRRFRQKVLYFFHRDLFFGDRSFRDSVEIIETMCDKMAVEGYVTSSYKAEIYEHEEISASSYGNVAIPHPLNNNAKSSIIAIAICRHPIQWGQNDVNLVFMLSLKEEDKELFMDIFDFITKIIREENTFNNIMNAKNFDEFINVLVSSY